MENKISEQIHLLFKGRARTATFNEAIVVAQRTTDLRFFD